MKMRIIYLLLPFLVILCANGQRRTTARTEAIEVEHNHPTRGRGRSRFTATQEFAQLNEPTKAPQVTTASRTRVTPRKRVNENVDRRAARTTEKPQKIAYEVEEIINESPIDSFRRQSKPRILTESRYEALNAPKRKLIEPPVPEVPEKLLKSLDNTVGDTIPEISSESEKIIEDDILSEFSDTTLKTNDIDLSSEGPKSNEITKEFTKSELITTPKPIKTDNRRTQNGARRNNFVRSRTTSAEISDESATQASRSRARTRATRRPDDASASATNSRAAQRGSRRQSDTPATAVDSNKKGSSIFTAEETQIVTRSRAGRRLGNGSPEKNTLNSPSTKSSDGGRNRPSSVTTPTPPRISDDTKKRPSFGSKSRNSDHATPRTPLRSEAKSRSRDVIPSLDEFSVPTVPSRNRFRSRDQPPIIDEQKLEVLPLFAAEPKTVAPVTKPKARSRSRNTKANDERYQVSATENDIKFTKPNEISSRVSVSRSESVNVKTENKPKVEEPVTQKTQVKESVIAEVSEVTSKRTVSRRKQQDKHSSSSSRTKVGQPKVSVSQVITSSRGKKKSEVNLNGVRKKKGDSSEEIDEADNYPEPFKALIQAKKNKKESRPSSRPHSTVPTITTTATSSTAPSTTVESTKSSKEDDDIENELDPKPSLPSKPPTRTTRNRLSSTTGLPEISATVATKRQTPRKSYKATRSTASPASLTPPTKEHKFHAKFSSTSSTRSESSPERFGRPSSLSRGLYSSRKNKDEPNSTREKLSKKNNVQTSNRTTQVPKSSSLKKSNRYSSKYRNDISSRGSGSRSTTSVPAYIPTIPTAAYIPTVPTVTPPSRAKVYSGAGTKDVDLGLEVISFDDPVNTVPSANLINGEYTSSTETTLTNPSVVNDGSTDKPVSIIERIINSITAISTTSPPDSFKYTSTASTTESSSAILKLATKKSTKHDKTKTTLDETQTYPIGTVAYTTEKPTTIIERIISSLSAIQATDDTNSNQVGKDFNTISSPPTTPVSRVTKSSTSRTTLPAQISTSVNPLKVLDEIADDQVLQKRTIGKLLALLNGLTSTTESERLVVVTPKPSSFISGADNNQPNSLTVSDTFSSSLSDTSSDSSTMLIPQTTVDSTIPTSTPVTTLITESSTSSDVSTPRLFTSAVDNSVPSVAIEGRIAESSSVITEAPPATTFTLSATQNTQTPTTTSTMQAESIAQTVMSTVPTQTEATAQTVSNTAQSTQSTTVTKSDVEGSPTNANQENVPDNSAASLPLDSGTTNSLLVSTPNTNTFPTATEVGLTGTTDIETLVTYLSTIPTLQNFEVSPGSVSIFSVNDISNSITPDENILTTVSISGRGSFETTATTESTTMEISTTDDTSTTSTSSPENIDDKDISQLVEVFTVENRTIPGGSVAQRIAGDVSIEVNTIQDDTTAPSVNLSTTSQPATTLDVTTDGATTQISANNSESDIESSTIQGGSDGSSPVDNVTVIPPPSTNNTMAMTDVSNQTSSNSSNNNSLSNRSGRLLNIAEEPVQNSLDVSTPSTTTSTTPDYFIFAVLNNNTILRKKPPTIPNKEVPYVVVGFYPNNTVVRRFPNGTLVPMEQIIRVRGFDIRENPPPLPEITSNQVTNDPGSPPDNNVQNVETVDQNTIPSIEPNPLSLDSVSSTSIAPETSLNTASTAGNTGSTTQSPTVVATMSSAAKSAQIVSTGSSTVAESSISSSVDSTTAPSTVPSTSVDPITNATTTTPVSTVPASSLATTTVSGTTLGSSTETPSQTLPALSELLNGRTLEALNDIINNTNSNTNTNTNYKTLQVNQVVTSTETPTVATTTTVPQATSTVQTTTSAVQTTQTPSSTIETTETVFTVTPAEATTQVQTTTKAASPVPLSNRILENTTPPATTTQITTFSLPVTTTTPSTREDLTSTRLTSTPTETVLTATTPSSAMTDFPSATLFPTFPTFPSFLTTLFPNILRVTPQSTGFSTTPTETIGFSASTPQPTTVVAPRGRARFNDITTVANTIPPSTSVPTTTTTTPITTTTPTTTTTSTTTTTTTTTTTPAPPTTTTTATTTTTRPTRRTTTRAPETTEYFISSTRRSVPLSIPDVLYSEDPVQSVSSTTPKLKQLSEQQKKDLETLAELEKQQAALLQQLSFLTSLNFGGNRNGGKKESNDLANRVVKLAVERDKQKTTTSPPKSIQDQLESLGINQKPKTGSPSIEDVLKQYNLTDFDIATTPSSTTYGRSSDAILASILKEQGIAPPTPKSLADQIKQAGVFETSTTKKPRPRTTTATTSRPRGRLIQGLNWLLNVLSPQATTTTTRRPRKPVKPKKPPVDQELLANSPTRLTPVVTSAPKVSPNSLSQEEIKKLISQLETAQKDPTNVNALDFSQIKSLQNLLNTDGGVQVLTNSQNGATSRVTNATPSTKKRRKQDGQGKRSTTVSTASVSNSVDETVEDFEDITTAKPRPSLPSLRLRPVAGVDDGGSDPMIRSNLITAAVNVTRAISGFLGTALQGAAQSFQSLLGSGSTLSANYSQGSSARPG